jgi:hypothetical protein
VITLIITLSDGDYYAQPIARANDARPTFEAVRAVFAGAPLGLRAERFVYISPDNREAE